jgi:3',5'-nucleoside bisphosphate phosphatase
VSVPAFDLQSHSLHSDGALPAAEVVARARAAGVALLALTDHDTVDGVDEALAAAGDGIEVVPAVEVSTIDGGHEDLHVVGYRVDHHDRRFRDRLHAWRLDRAARVTRMEDALRDLGWAVDDTPLAARRAADEPVGRPHLAQAVFDEPANRARLRAEGLADEPGQVLEAYLIPGAPAFRRRTTPTVGEAIAAIHEAGGVAVWAHPFWDVDDPADVVATLRRFRDEHGLDGVEAFYPTHTAEQTRLLARTAADLGLLTTGSGDFHGPDHAHFAGFRTFDLHGETPVLGRIAATG